MVKGYKLVPIVVPSQDANQWDNRMANDQEVSWPLPNLTHWKIRHTLMVNGPQNLVGLKTGS